MTRTARRLAELDAISRERPLTAAEQDDAYRLVRLQRQCELRRQRYASDPSYRQKMLLRERDWRLENGGHRRRWEVAADPAVREQRRMLTASRGRDGLGRFV